MNIQSVVTPGELFDADDTEGALMAATYRALCKHGYADLTIQKIGAEFEKSNSLLYHHYEGKDDLLVEFLEYMLERFETEVPFEEVDDPRAKLQRLLDYVLAPDPDEERHEFTSAMTELRAQAAHNRAYREAFTRHDEFFHDGLASMIREGIEQGSFRAVDPDRMASFVQTTFNGVMLQRATTDPDDGVPVEDVQREIEAVLETRLVREDAR